MKNFSVYYLIKIEEFSVKVKKLRDFAKISKFSAIPLNKK